jgi:hypothetical protein
MEYGQPIKISNATTVTSLDQLHNDISIHPVIRHEEKSGKTTGLAN